MLFKTRRQSGQAIVLIALMMIVLFGFLGLAVDGGREYVQRREVQAATDAAALAAGDKYLNTNDETASENAAAAKFASDMRIGSGLGGATFSALGSDNTTVTWSDYTGSLTMQVSHNAFNGTLFLMTATSSLPLAFMQVLGQGPNASIGAVAQSVVQGQTQTPALLTLSQGGCPNGSGTSLSIQGNSNVALVGALYSDGGITAQGSIAVTVAGNAFDQCGSIPGTITLVCYNPHTNPPSSDGPPNGTTCPTGDTLGKYYPGSPPLPDPGYTAPTVPTNSQGAPGNNVELAPGVYPNVLMPGHSPCYFLLPGVYSWSGGLKMNGGLFSNELRPPDEPVPGNVTNRQSPQFWLGTGNNVVDCDGSFSVQSVTSSAHPLQNGTWGVVVTSVRTNDNGYIRESGPSMCRTVGTDGATRGFQVAVSNVPGAQQYNIYANPAGCGQSTFGYVGSITGVSDSTEQNNNTAGCPYTPAWPANNAPATPTTGTVFSATCSMGYEISKVFDSNSIGRPFTISGSYCSTTSSPSLGCAYPVLSPSSAGANDGGLQPPTASGNPDKSPNMDIPSNGGGDRANEYECRDQSSSNTVANPCQGAATTPGAVQFYFPPSQCLDLEGNGNVTTGDIYIFGGRQYEGIVMYAPANNTCSSMKMAGGNVSTAIGTVYMPGATLTLRGHSDTVVSGQVIVYSATIDGSAGTQITYNPALSPPPPGARLIK